MSERMTKEREGFHNMFVQIPSVLWDALAADADTSGASVARILTEILRRHYGVKRESLPKLKRAGRPPKR